MREPFSVVYEDNHVLVVVKAPNILSQADATGDTDLLSLLKGYIGIKYQKPGAVYLGLLHRLDRPVGGLMVFARTSKAAGRLSEQLRTHAVSREYLLVVQGELHEPFTLTDYLLKDEEKNRVAIVPEGTQAAKKAVLNGLPLGIKDGKTLLSVGLETGRAHQIRVQMAGLGHPLWGDARYGHGKPGEQIALWGYRLSFTHPVTQKPHAYFSRPEGAAFISFSEEIDAQAF